MNVSTVFPEDYPVHQEQNTEQQPDNNPENEQPNHQTSSSQQQSNQRNSRESFFSSSYAASTRQSVLHQYLTFEHIKNEHKKKHNDRLAHLLWYFCVFLSWYSNAVCVYIESMHVIEWINKRRLRSLIDNSVYVNAMRQIGNEVRINFIVFPRSQPRKFALRYREVYTGCFSKHYSEIVLLLLFYCLDDFQSFVWVYFKLRCVFENLLIVEDKSLTITFFSLICRTSSFRIYPGNPLCFWLPSH